MTWQLWVNPTWKNDTLDIFDQLLLPGETVIDIGANIGLMSLTAARAVGPQGHVHAIEPHPRIAACLQANLQLNKASQVQCHMVAAGEKAGTSYLTDDRRDDMNYLQDSALTEAKCLPVKVVALDDLLPSLEHCHLLKLDVEGRELDCLRGAKSTLEKCETLLVEAGDANSTRFGFTARDLHEFLREKGFKVFTWEQQQLCPVVCDHYHDQVCDWLASRAPEKLLQRLTR